MSEQVQEQSAQPTIEEKKSVTNLTYDKLFEILRSEKSEASLQQLPPTFYSDVCQYLKLKSSALKKSQESKNAFAIEHQEMALSQLKNALRIIVDIYDRREKKIVMMALNKSRTKSLSAESEHLLAEEQSLFAQVVDLLAIQRNGLITNLLQEQAQQQPKVQKVETARADEPQYVSLSEIPQFYGPNLEQYGPFSIGQQMQLPTDVAMMLLKNGQIRTLS